MLFRPTLLLTALLTGVGALAQDVPPPPAPPATGTATEQVPLQAAAEMPRFPGGDQAMHAYIVRNLQYPEDAIEQEIQGTVYIRFAVEADGRVNEVQVLRGIGGGCDEEAARVVQRMPLWKPGTEHGEPVRAVYTIPIRFQLMAEEERPAKER